MPAIEMLVLCIPTECDNIILPIDVEVASRWDAYLLCDICRHFASVMLHFALLITHNLRCIPAYTHLIPTGFFQSSLHDYRENMYIIAKKKQVVLSGCLFQEGAEMLFGIDNVGAVICHIPKRICHHVEWGRGYCQALDLIVERTAVHPQIE